jgi:hypothetical protein
MSLSAMAPDCIQHRFAAVLQQMPAVRDLNGVSGTLVRAVGIGACSEGGKYRCA